MDKVRSLYLDFVRVMASFYVFLYHISSEKLGDIKIFSDESFQKFISLHYLGAHYFVIVFFVLSGLLITMSASRQNITVKTFLIARTGRIYSVLIPALISSIIIAKLLIVFNYYPAEVIPNTSNVIVRIFLNLSFTFQSWHLMATPPLNNPFWSVGYEFMYYLIICSLLIVKRYKFFWVLFFCIIAGPKVMLLFPAWLLGSGLYYLVSKEILPGLKLSAILYFISLFVFFLVISGKFILPFTANVQDGSIFNYQLFFSWNYVADYIMAVIVAVNIYSLFGLSGFLLKFCNNSVFDKSRAFLVKLSNCSFTLYLFHLPLLFLLSAVLPYDKHNLFHVLGLAGLVLLITFFIARQTEWKVVFWRMLTEDIYNFLTAKYKGLKA